ncbi:MAG: hypothetical protein ACJLS2_01445 [Microcella pacifica]
MTMNGTTVSAGPRLRDDLLARIEDAHDGGVGHARRGLRLLAESRAEDRVAREGGLQQLDGDAPAELGVRCHVHVGHAAAADEGPQLVAAREHPRTLRDIVHRHRILTAASDSITV